MNFKLFLIELPLAIIDSVILSLMYTNLLRLRHNIAFLRDRWHLFDHLLSIAMLCYLVCLLNVLFQSEMVSILVFRL